MTLQDLLLLLGCERKGLSPRALSAADKIVTIPHGGPVRSLNLATACGIMMYAEVYKWFTETSGLGLMEQAAKLMHPKQAAKEEDIADVMELWEEKVNRLARNGMEYHVPDVYRKVALKQMLVGNIRDNCDL